MASIITLFPRQDAYVNSNRWNTRFGRRIALKVGRDRDGAVYRSFLRFGLSCLASDTLIQRAELRLFVRRNPPGPAPKIVAVRSVRRGWSEAAITWANQPGAGGVAATEVVDEAPDETATFDVTDLVRRWITGTLRNNGLMLRASNEGHFSFVKFGSRERHIPEMRPQLVITLAGTPCPPPRRPCFRSKVEMDLLVTSVPRSVLLQDVGCNQMTTYFVHNKGNTAVVAKLQLSPDGQVWLDDPPPQEVEPGESAAFVPRLLLRFARLRVQTQDPAETARLTVWFQTQSTG